MREAAPGALKLPMGAKDRETILGLRAELDALKIQVAELAAMVAAPKPETETEPDKDALVEEAAALGIAARSTLQRWGVGKLTTAIAEAKEA